MHIGSESFAPGKSIPVEFAMGAPDGFGGNRNPQLHWDDVPGNTRSFVLLCIDTDAPTDGNSVKPIPVDQPRTEFTHWVMADIPADQRSIAAGKCSNGVTAHGKHAPSGPTGVRQGINDYTNYFDGNADMTGDYRGYDGPYPPANDLRVHRYFFRLFALDCERLPLADRFTAADVFGAMHGHVLTEAAVWGTYSLNPGIAAPQ